MDYKLGDRLRALALINQTKLEHSSANLKCSQAISEAVCTIRKVLEMTAESGHSETKIHISVYEQKVYIHCQTRQIVRAFPAKISVNYINEETLQEACSLLCKMGVKMQLHPGINESSFVIHCNWSE